MTALWTASFYILLLNVLRKCIHGEISLYQSFYWRDLILCINNIDMLSMCMKKCHSKKINFWQSFIDNYCGGGGGAGGGGGGGIGGGGHGI